LTKYVTPTQLGNYRGIDTNNLNNKLAGKVNYTDSITKYVTPTQLSSQINTYRNIDTTLINTKLADKVNYTDSITKYVTPTQLGSYRGLDTTTLNNKLAGKVNYTDSLTTYVTPTQLGQKTIKYADTGYVYGIDTSTIVNFYSILTSAHLNQYAQGMVIVFKAGNTNTSTCNVNVNGLGVKSIKKNVSSGLAASDIAANQMVMLIYDGVNFQISNPKNYSTSSGSTSNNTLIYTTDGF
jgi:hypothetical protein